MIQQLYRQTWQIDFNLTLSQFESWYRPWKKETVKILPVESLVHKSWSKTMWYGCEVGLHSVLTFIMAHVEFIISKRNNSDLT